MGNLNEARRLVPVTKNTLGLSLSRELVLPAPHRFSPALTPIMPLHPPFQTLEQKLQVKKLPTASLKMNNST